MGGVRQANLTVPRSSQQVVLRACRSRHTEPCGLFFLKHSPKPPFPQVCLRELKADPPCFFSLFNRGVAFCHTILLCISAGTILHLTNQCLDCRLPFANSIAFSRVCT